MLASDDYLASNQLGSLPPHTKSNMFNFAYREGEPALYAANKINTTIPVPRGRSRGVHMTPPPPPHFSALDNEVDW